MVVKVKEQREESEFMKKLRLKFEKGMNSSLESFSKQINVSLGKLNTRLKNCERTMKRCVKKLRGNFDSELNIAENLVNKELRSKIIMSQWTNKFLSSIEQKNLDPITFGLSRYCLNIALCFQDITPIQILDTQVHKQMVDIIASKSNNLLQLVQGPALMALVHISLYPEIKQPLVLVGVMPAILKILTQSKSMTILALGAKLVASLAIEGNNKTIISQSGCIHALFDLILGAHVDVDVHIQRYSLHALINCIYQSDANRLLSLELHGIKPLLTLLQSTAHEELIVSAARCLANIAYSNPFTANAILIAGGGEVLMAVLEACDVSNQPLIAHAILAAMSNMCSSESNQTHVGNINGLLDAALRICEYSNELYLVTESANFLLSCCYKNTINKARIANRGGCGVMMRRLIKQQQLAQQTLQTQLGSQPLHTNNNQEQHYQQQQQHYQQQLACCERIALALSSVLLYKATHEAMIVCNGIQDIIRLIKANNEPLLLQAFAKILVTMVPNPDDILRAHKDNSLTLAEKLNVLPALKKVKVKGYADVALPPDWLEIAIVVLSMNDEDLAQAAPLIMNEFVTNKYFSKEFNVRIKADMSIQDSCDLRGMLFSIY